jgi:hypothetical protein
MDAIIACRHPIRIEAGRLKLRGGSVHEVWREEDTKIHANCSRKDHAWAVAPRGALTMLKSFGHCLGIHLMLKRTGTTNDKALSGALPGGLGIGWARASMARVSSSSTDDPELCTIRLLSK